MRISYYGALIRYDFGMMLLDTNYHSDMCLVFEDCMHDDAGYPIFVEPLKSVMREGDSLYNGPVDIINARQARGTVYVSKDTVIRRTSKVEGLERYMSGL